MTIIDTGITQFITTANGNSMKCELIAPFGIAIALKFGRLLFPEMPNRDSVQPTTPYELTSEPFSEQLGCSATSVLH
jgi:hypothetical protein